MKRIVISLFFLLSTAYAQEPAGQSPDQDWEQAFAEELPEDIFEQLFAEEAAVRQTRPEMPIIVDHALVPSTWGGSMGSYGPFRAYYEPSGSDEPRSGLPPAPFESYFIAREGLKVDASTSPALVPGLDDAGDFQRVLEAKWPEVQAVFLSLDDERAEGVFWKIVDYPESAWLMYLGGQWDREVVYRLFTRQHLSPYLFERVRDKGVDYFEDAISESLKARLEATPVALSLPPLYSKDHLRRRALRALADFARDNRDYSRVSGMRAAVDAACGAADPASAEVFCVGTSGPVASLRLLLGRTSFEPEATMRNVDAFLRGVLGRGSEVVPVARMREGDLREHYPFFASLWASLGERSTVFEAARTDEYTYLVAQQAAGNPWARLRLGYLVAMEDETTLPFRAELGAAARALGLDRPLAHGYADGLLTLEEKKALWADVVEGGEPLFAFAEGDATIYDVITDISYQRFFSAQDAEAYVERAGIGHMVDDEARAAWEGGALARLVPDRWTLRTIVEEAPNLRLLSSLEGSPAGRGLADGIVGRHGIDEALVSDYILDLDASFKAPLYESVLRYADRVRTANAPAPLLWRAEKDGRVAYLFGTIHSGVSLADLPWALRSIIGASSVVLTETDPDGTSYGEALEATILPEGRSLEDMLSPASWRKLVRLSGSKGIPEENLRWFTPLMAVLALLSPEDEPDSPSLDDEIREYGRQRGLPMGYLDDSIGVLAGDVLNADFLELSLEDYSEDGIVAEFERDFAQEPGRLEGCYLSSDIPCLIDFVRPLLTPSQNRSAYEAAFGRRNRSWVPVILDALGDSDGPVFAAFGAAHLFGSEGVPALLRKQGFSVERVRFSGP